MPITSPLRICYLQHKEPEKTAKPVSVKWDPAEPDAVGIAFDDGTFLVWKYSNGLKKLYNLQQSAMPLPTFDSDKDINATLPDAYGVTDPRPVTSPWLDFNFALVYDHREMFFAFSNSNKVHRTYLPDPSNVDMDGYTSGSGVFEFAAHRLPITAFTTSPLIENEPPRLLTGSEDGTIILWDASVPCNDDLRDIGARTIHVINAHEGSVVDVAFAGLEFYISSGQDKAIRIWNINTGEQACYFHTEKVLVSKIECGPLSRKSYAIVAGSERGSVFMWKMNLPRKGSDDGDDNDDEELDESMKVVEDDDYISVRLVGMADHTERPISSISLFPIKSRYGEDDGAGVACGNKEGGLYVYKYGRSSLLKQPSDIDANDENISFKNMPTHAFELLHQAKYGSSLLSNQARYELNLNRSAENISSAEVVLLLSAASEGEVDVLKVPPAGHRTRTESQVSKSGESDFSLLVTLNDPEDEEEHVDVEEEEERNRQQESPKRQSTMSPQRSPMKRSQSGASDGNIRFGSGFETVLNISRKKKPEEEVPKEEIPEPEPHPMITYNQVGLPTEEDLENADAWAEEEFDATENGEGGVNDNSNNNNNNNNKNNSGTKNAARTPSSNKKTRSRFHKQTKNMFGPKIAKSFHNPERARALIEVEKNYRADYHAVDDGRDGIQKLGFHGGDPPYFSKTNFPVSELQEPVLQSSIALRDTIAKLNATSFDKRAAIRDTVVPVNPKNVNVERSQMKYMELVDVNAPTPVKNRTVRKQISKKYLKERLNNKNKLDIFDAPGLKSFQKAESTLKDKVDFYAPAEPKLFFNELDLMGVGTGSRGRFNMNSGF